MAMSGARIVSNSHNRHPHLVERRYRAAPSVTVTAPLARQASERLTLHRRRWLFLILGVRIDNDDAPAGLERVLRAAGVRIVVAGLGPPPA